MNICLFDIKYVIIDFPQIIQKQYIAVYWCGDICEQNDLIAGAERLLDLVISRFLMQDYICQKMFSQQCLSGLYT